ncbi:uncharacterized protein LOC110052015 [Orbicella faveolata]|uniref:uncharacterized protein LOC110052015 n=1 Tax=Orbicella faveolata TaxID=48498 RepID=UPI0009E44328|nr:uncharacterized protein LOC110052015 [Orbicella faveolata]
MMRIFGCFSLPYRVQFRRINIAFILFIACCGIGVVLYFSANGIVGSNPQLNTEFKKTLRVKYVKRVGNYSSACRLPNLDPFHPSILEFVKDLGKLQCQGERYSTFINNVLEVKGDGFAAVQYRTIERPDGDDFNVTLSAPKRLLNIAEKTTENPADEGLFRRFWNWITRTRKFPFLGKATVKADFVRVDVVTTRGRKWSDVHMQIFPKEEVATRPVEPVGIPLDIALIMYDSTSAANFKRKMPNTLEYLTKNLNSILLEGETIVGDGTTAQLCAMLTGIAEKKQPEARRGENSSDTVDKWRWIFRDFKQKGYATLFSEDSPLYASFNYRLHGFRDPPTDHFARPFWLEAENIIQKYCIGGRAAHNISLEYLLSFFRAYKDKPKFSLITHAVISHQDLNPIGYVDDDLKSVLQTMKNENFLKNTMLVIFGDHGIRFSGLRKTIQGKLEERLPFISLTLPEWFKEKHPDLYRNLVHNSKVLTTPFDVYATFRHILSYPSYPASEITTGQSLFSKIDGSNRTCENAGVEEHWCPCLNLEEVSTDEPLIKDLALFAVKYMNNLMFQNSQLKKLCQTLVLKEINSAFRDMPSQEMQFFSESKRDEECDSCGVLFGEKSTNTLLGDTLYQLQFTTSPNEGVYEASVRTKKGVPSLAGDVSRIDAYKDQPYCIAKKFPLLRKYCYCH